MTLLDTDPLLIQELRRDEGVRYSPYADTRGFQTVGVGHNLHVSPLPQGWTYPLNDEQVNALLTVDLDGTFAGLDAHIPWWRNLSYARQRVMVNMAYNMGVNGLMGFPHTLADIKAGNYAQAATDMSQSLWAKQVGARATRLEALMIAG